MAKIFLVIHYLNLNTALKNAAIAAENKCEGVFLINMEGDHSKLNGPARAIQRKFPELKVGTNRIGISPVDAIEENEKIGITITWSDTCGVHSFFPKTPLKKEIKATLKKYPKHKFFGAVAFKGQKNEPQPAIAAKEAFDHGFIPVTSGSATGSPPNVRKIQRMAEVLPKKKLGLASGVTPENASEFISHCGFIFVSTGISKDFHKVRELSGIPQEKRAHGTRPDHQLPDQILAEKHEEEPPVRPIKFRRPGTLWRSAAATCESAKIRLSSKTRLASRPSFQRSRPSQRLAPPLHIFA